MIVFSFLLINLFIAFSDLKLTKIVPGLMQIEVLNFIYYIILLLTMRNFNFALMRSTVYLIKSSEIDMFEQCLFWCTKFPKFLLKLP